MWKGVNVGQTLKGDNFEDFLTEINIEEIAVEACPLFN
jgi:hypothetical protein